MSAAAMTPDLIEAADRAVPTARRWLDTSRQWPADRAALLLSQVLEDPDGLAFVVGFVDGVIRPEDPEVAARALHRLSRDVPESLPAALRAAVRAGGAVAQTSPEVVVPVVRQVLQMIVGDLVVDVSDRSLGRALRRLGREGVRLNINLLGEAVLGGAEAERRLARVGDLLNRDDVDYVSMKVSAVLGPHNPWAFDAAVAEAVATLEPIFRKAAASSAAGRPKFINLDMEEYHDLHVTTAVFRRILDLPGMEDYEAGIVLQSYLPDALPVLQELTTWATARVDAGGAPIKVRVVKGANLMMERVGAELHGWPLVTWESRTATDANYLRMLDWALDPAHTRAVRVGVAGHNLFTVAAAWELAGLRGCRDGMEIEMLSGMAAPQARAIQQDVGQLLLYVPVVDPGEYDVAISYLVRRLEENAAPENFMASVFDIAEDADVFDRERDRFLAAVDMLAAEGDSRVGPARHQDRRDESPADVGMPADRMVHGFANTPDSDSSLLPNLAWARDILARIPESPLGIAEVDAARVDADGLEKVLGTAAQAAGDWAARPASERAEILHRMGVELGLARGDLVEVAGAECGKTLDQADVEVSEAIDFCHYYATRALEVERLDGARLQPAQVTAVCPPWNFPLAIPAGGMAAALAAGSTVVIKPAPPAGRCAALLVEAAYRAGVPREVLHLTTMDDGEVSEMLVRDPRVERVVLTGSSDTAELFRSWRPDLQLMAETSGKNAIIVTPSADRDLAVADIVASAFGHAGQKCSAASLVILVGSVGSSTRFRDQLVDAVQSLVVGWPGDPRTQMGPLTEPPGDKLRAGFTELGRGESWVLEPRPLDDTGRLWSPGLRVGVRPGSAYHLTEYFGPILGIMQAPDLSTAIRWQNATAYGLTAGLHSLEAREISRWLERVEAGNVYVNRGITGAIVRRQPFGGWKRSAVGTGAKAGGPNYLYGFGDLVPVEDDPAVAPAPGLADVDHPTLRQLVLLGHSLAGIGALSTADAAWLERSCVLDQRAYDTEFGAVHDPSGLACERNILRYRATPVTIRLGEGAPLVHLLRELSAGSVVGAPLEVSASVDLPEELDRWLGQQRITVTLEDDGQFARRAAARDWGLDGRIRLVGGDRSFLMDMLGGSIDVAVHAEPPVRDGRVAILPYVHEQAISMTAHRFGNPTPLPQDVRIPPAGVRRHRGRRRR